jgi:hypothetical protein
MASIIWYGSGSIAAWLLGKNLATRVANGAIDYVLNSNATSIIKDPHTARSINGMLETYKNIEVSHPAYEAMLNVKKGVKKLEDLVARAELRREVHCSGYLSRWRAFDASYDNNRIDVQTQVLMTRLEIFAQLLKCSDHTTATIYDDPPEEND